MVDDIWNNRIKLEDIGIPAADDHTWGCKVVLTSRRKDVCDIVGVKDYQIGVLLKDEAWSLFEKRLGDSINHPEMQSIAEAVCGQCGGLPLAILAVAGALKNKSKQVWEDALQQLINSSADNIGEITAEVYSRIKLSYKYLEPNEARSILLLCCLFPEDADILIEYLVRYAFARRLCRNIDTMKKAWNRTLALIDILKTHSLLLDGESDEFVKMHDVIRDVAISISSEKEDDIFLVEATVKKWPEKDKYKHCRTISLQLNGDCVFPDDLQCPDLHSLMLECCNGIGYVPSCSFDVMEKLEVLHMDGISIKTLPSSLRSLRMLRLYYCQLVNLAFLKELKDLEILIIADDGLKELAPEIRQLTRLRVLDLRNCNKFKVIPSGVISSLSQLEELYLPYNFDQWELNGNASLNELDSLRGLTNLHIHVPNGMLLPLNELQCMSLFRFRISIASVFVWPSTTKMLTLKGIPFTTELSILMEKAELLSLTQLKGLKDVFQQKDFPDLKCLKVEDCDGMEHLFVNPKSLPQMRSGSFTKLIALEVRNCHMRSLFCPAMATCLPQLRELDIVNCEMLEEIISDDQEFMYISFPRLKNLMLSRLPNLRGFFVNIKKISTMRCNTTSLVQALFNDKVSFPALETLYISKLESLTAVWDNQSEAHDSFWELKSVTVEGCDKIVNVIPPNVVPWLRNNLGKLKVKSCGSVVSVVEVTAFEEGSDEILMFTQLNTLKLQKLQKLETFCYSSSGGSKEEDSGKILVFPRLNYLELEELPTLGKFCCSRRGGEEIIAVEEEKK